MQEATPDTVLGDFDDATVTQFGVTSRFYRKGDEFWTRTEGPDGALHDYRIDYTFGVYPLQQYLIAFPGGRWQALSLAWDTRPQDQGGQRWFHLIPTRRSTTTTSCTGPGSIRTGTGCAPTATRPTSPARL